MTACFVRNRAKEIDVKTNWAAERRLDYIDFRLVTDGTIRRSDIIDTFGVSMPQASVDLNRFLVLYPKAMAYDKSAKQYVARKGFTTRRGHSANVIRSLTTLRAEGYPLGWQ